MTKGVFREYKRDAQDWSGTTEKRTKNGRFYRGISADFWNSLYDLNQNLKNKGSAQTLVTLVANSNFVNWGKEDGDLNNNLHSKMNYELRVDTVASPISLMRAKYVDISAGNILKSIGGVYLEQKYAFYNDDEISEKYNDSWVPSDVRVNNGKLKRYVKYSNAFRYFDVGGDSFTISTAKSTWEEIFPQWKTSTGESDDEYWGNVPTPMPTGGKPTIRPTTRKPTHKPTMHKSPTRAPVPKPTHRPTDAKTPSPTPKPTEDTLYRIKDKTPTPTSTEWDARFSNDPMDLEINKYSLWVAAAVNMGVLSFDDLM